MSDDHPIRKVNNVICERIPNDVGIRLLIYRQIGVVTKYSGDHDSCKGVFPVRNPKNLIRFANVIALSHD